MRHSHSRKKKKKKEFRNLSSSYSLDKLPSLLPSIASLSPPGPQTPSPSLPLPPLLAVYTPISPSLSSCFHRPLRVLIDSVAVTLFPSLLSRPLLPSLVLSPLPLLLCLLYFLEILKTIVVCTLIFFLRCVSSLSSTFEHCSRKICLRRYRSQSICTVFYPLHVPLSHLFTRAKFPSPLPSSPPPLSHASLFPFLPARPPFVIPFSVSTTLSVLPFLLLLPASPF